VSAGYMGRVLWVDLTEGVIGEEELGEEVCRDFIGGYGIGARLLFDRLGAQVAPLSAANILGFMTGPLTGTAAIGSSRFTVMGKSPLTLGWGDANCGGDFGPIMKMAGYDGVFFTGASEDPVFLAINDGVAQLQDAADLWGLDAYETEAELKRRLGKGTSVATIGPSGERVCLIASIMNDKGRAAGRSGLGAVMGSKRLKAIAVRGNRRVPVADSERMKELRKLSLASLGGPRSVGDGLSYQTYRRWGTAGNLEGLLAVGDCPVRNWAGLPSEVANVAAISDDSYEKYKVRRYACWHCPVGCGAHVVVPTGQYACEAKRPEYETIGALGSMCLNDNIEAIIRANDLCNRYGLDTISAGATVAFAMECFERGLISTAETDGLELTWGNHEAVVCMIERMCKREGFGDVLADGTRMAAERIGHGAEEFAMHIGGQELPMHDGRFFPGLALTYWIDPTPGRHTQSAEEWTPPFLDAMPEDASEYAGRGEMHLRSMAFMQFLNCTGLCMLATECIDAELTLEYMAAASGRNYNFAQMLTDGERVMTLRHLFNLREGQNPLDRRIPGRTIGLPPQESGPLEGITVDIDRMRVDYYRRLGWDLETSMPSTGTLERLGLRTLFTKKTDL
jgi:aldehyde:ferredoxin oxidoreductase